MALTGSTSAQGSGAAEVLTNQSVLGMTAAKLNKDLLLAKVIKAMVVKGGGTGE
jgi:hypothetical protein